MKLPRLKPAQICIPEAPVSETKTGIPKPSEYSGILQKCVRTRMLTISLLVCLHYTPVTVTAT